MIARSDRNTHVFNATLFFSFQLVWTAVVSNLWLLRVLKCKYNAQCEKESYFFSDIENGSDKI